MVRRGSAWCGSFQFAHRAARLSIARRSVKVRATALESMADQTDCFITIRACAVAVAETHASNPDCRDLDTSQKTLLHVIPPCEVREPRARIAPFGRLGVIIPSYETQITGGRSRFEIGGTASA